MKAWRASYQAFSHLCASCPSSSHFGPSLAVPSCQELP